MVRTFVQISSIQRVEHGNKGLTQGKAFVNKRNGDNLIKGLIFVSI